MEKSTHNTTKNKVHIVYFFKLVICPVVRVFSLESLIWLQKYISSGVDCVVSWGTRRSLHGLGFHRIEDHGVTLLTVASWRGDLVLIKYISSFLWISEIYITHKKQESGELFIIKSWNQTDCITHRNWHVGNNILLLQTILTWDVLMTVP
jgi:hypothetical protein